MIILCHNTFFFLYFHYCANRISNANRGESPRQGKERNNLQNEILTALFNDAERSEELSRRKTKAERSSIVYGELAAEPPTDFTLENKADSVYSQQDNDKGRTSLTKYFLFYRNLLGLDALVAHSQEIWDLEFIFWLLWARFHFGAATLFFHSSSVIDYNL